jgi:hypothetical protein
MPRAKHDSARRDFAKNRSGLLSKKAIQKEMVGHLSYFGAKALHGKRCEILEEEFQSEMIDS